MATPSEKTDLLIADLRRRVLAGESTSADDYAKVIASIRVDRTAIAASSVKPKAAIKKKIKKKDAPNVDLFAFLGKPGTQ